MCPKCGDTKYCPYVYKDKRKCPVCGHVWTHNAASPGLVMTIDLASRITDVLIDRRGAPLVGYWVALHTKDLTTWHYSEAPTDRTGLFTVTVPAGVYTVSYSPNRDGPFTMVTEGHLAPDPVPTDEISEAARRWDEYLK